MTTMTMTAMELDTPVRSGRTEGRLSGKATVLLLRGRPSISVSEDAAPEIRRFVNSKAFTDLSRRVSRLVRMATLEEEEIGAEVLPGPNRSISVRFSPQSWYPGTISAYRDSLLDPQALRKSKLAKGGSIIAGRLELRDLANPDPNLRIRLSAPTV